MTFNLYNFTSIDNANKQGFNAGLHNTNKPFKSPINKYQRAYNEGNIGGMYIRSLLLPMRT